MLIGIAERSIVTTLVLWTPKLAAGFIGGWVVLKLAGGWSPMLKDPTVQNRSAYMVSMLGNVVSLGWALGVTLWASPQAIAALSS